MPERGRTAATFYWASLACWIALGLALRWQALETTLLCDDWDHYAMYAGVYPLERGPLDMFNFVGDSEAERAALRATGRLPWWSSRDIHLSVFRPVSSALLHFDYAVLNAAQHPQLAHAHSLLWWVVLMLGVGTLFWNLLPMPVAALAALLYALDDAHTLPVVWTANRSELVATALMMWSLCFYLIARTQARARLLLLSYFLLACGLYAGEYAFGLLAYLVAIELSRGSEPLSSRFKTLAPVVLIVLVYLIPRQMLGYAVRGSSFYIDPMFEPLRFLAACTQRIPMLLADLVFGYSPEWVNWAPPWVETVTSFDLLPAAWLSLDRLRTLQLVLELVATVVTFAVIYALGRARASSTDRSLRWLLIGAFLSLVPLCGTVPMTRLTVGAAVGVSAAIATLLHTLYLTTLRTRSTSLRIGAALAGLLIVGVHGVYAGRKTFTETNFQAVRSHSDEAWALNAELRADDLPSQHVFILSAPDWASQLALPYIWQLNRHVMPLSSEVLSPSPETGGAIMRVTPNAFDLQIAPNSRAYFNRSGYRRVADAFNPGDRFSLGRFEVVIMAVEAGEPTTIRFVFPAELEDRRYVFLHPVATGLRRIIMPKVGARIELPTPTWPSASF